MQRCDLQLSLDPSRDDFVLWLRWVAMERPPSPDLPPGQGLRAQMLINRRSVFGPTIFPRADLEAQGRYALVPRDRWRALLLDAAPPRWLDLQLVIHGSVANAPYMALFHVRDRDPEQTLRSVPGTPLLQLTPSVPGDRWQVAGQASLRVALDLQGPGRRLNVLQTP